MSTLNAFKIVRNFLFIVSHTLFYQVTFLIKSMIYQLYHNLTLPKLILFIIFYSSMFLTQSKMLKKRKIRKLFQNIQIKCTVKNNFNVKFQIIDSIIIDKIDYKLTYIKQITTLPSLVV